MPLRAWLKSANHAIEGVLYGARTQKHLRYHFFSAAAVLFFSYMVGVSKAELVIIALAVILVLAAEMMNSAIEAVVDILSPDYSEKAKVAKDIAAGAVLITAFGAAVLGYVVLFPYVKTIFSEGFHIAKHSKEEISFIAFVLVLIAVNLYISALCFLLAVWIAQSSVTIRMHTRLEVMLGALLGTLLTFLLFRLFY